MKINKKELTIEGLQEEYYFLHITDTHAGRENLTRDGISAAERLKEYVEYANEERLSGVLLTGDIIDNPALENLTLLKRQLEALQVPYLYIPGNHDWAFADDYHTDVATSRDWSLLQPFCRGGGDFSGEKDRRDHLDRYRQFHGYVLARNGSEIAEGTDGEAE